jgi:peptidoglycan/xylan/chitin deacetylase (PgdA/CDA1 family)
MRKTLKDILYGAVHTAGLNGLLLRKNRRHVPVLLYHGVTDRRWPGVLDCEKKHIFAEDFERQLVFLKENFQVVRLSSYAASLRGGEPLPEGCAVITFDDGYADNHAVAFPLLRKHGLPATVFLAADFMTKGTPLWVDRLAWAFDRTELGDWKDPVEGTRFPLATDAGKTACYLWVKRRLKLLPDAEREGLVGRICDALLDSLTPEPPDLFSPLSREQVREMADSGLIELGSHGCRHAILTAMPEAEARREIVDSRKILEEFCGKPVASFSYPNAGFNSAVARMVEEAGYDCAVAGGLRLNEPGNTDPFAIRRLALAEGDSEAVMAATLSGIRGRLIAWSGGSA